MHVAFFHFFLTQKKARKREREREKGRKRETAERDKRHNGCSMLA
jgi:hypothetical protein